MKLDLNKCLICFKALDSAYKCKDEVCHNKYTYEFNDDMADFYLGPRAEGGYIVEYTFNSDGTFNRCRIFARPFSKHICDFPEPLDFQNQTEDQILKRIEKLKTFA